MNLKYIAIVLTAAVSLLFGNSLKGQNTLLDGEDVYRFYIKLSSEALIDIEKGKVQSFSKTRSAENGLLERLDDFSFQQLVSFSDSERSELRSGRRVRSVAGAKRGYDKSDFSGLLELDAARYMDKNELLKLAEELERYSAVEYCELTPLSPPPPPSVDRSGTYVSPMTSDYSDKQFYLYGNSGGDIIGIYADYAWSLGITGQGVSIADIEWGWDYQHEDFIGQNMVDGLHSTNEQHNDHGTAVCGQMFAADNGYGVTGAVHGADAFIGFSEITRGRSAAILMALDSLKAGDVLLYEMQSGGQNGEYVPADISQSIWDITKRATDAGIIVVAAAGNGSQNLDGSYYSSYMARGDNGSIIVGAGTKVGRNRVGFSTYGSRVNLCGIGDWSIYTTGYGSLSGSGHTSYTHNFSGTSSSTPIVASAAVAVQSYAKSRLGKTLTPAEMRELLTATGTAQGSGGHIGPLPNIKAAIKRLDSLSGNSYSLTVINGSNTGTYPENATVSVAAKDSAGYVFDMWTGDVQTLSSVMSKSTVLTMPAYNVQINATYKKLDMVRLNQAEFSVNSSSSQWNDNYGNSQVLDGNRNTFWHSASGSTLPAEVVFRLNSSYSLAAFAYLPRQDKAGGSVKDYRLEVSSDGNVWSEVTRGVFSDSKDESLVEFEKTAPVNYVKLVMSSSYVSNDKVSLADFNLYYKPGVSFSVHSSSSQWGNGYGNSQIPDDNVNTFWHSASGSTLPAEVVFRFSEPFSFNEFTYLPRQDKEGGSVKDYRLEVSSDGNIWSEVISGRFSDTKMRSVVELSKTAPVSYVKLVMTSSYASGDRVSIADVSFSDRFNSNKSITGEPPVFTPLLKTVSPEMVMENNRVRLSGFSGAAGVVSLFSVNGRMLMNRRVSFAEGATYVDLSSLSRGVMIMRVQGESTELTEKIAY